MAVGGEMLRHGSIVNLLQSWESDGVTEVPKQIFMAQISSRVSFMVKYLPFGKLNATEGEGGPSSLLNSQSPHSGLVR